MPLARINFFPLTCLVIISSNNSRFLEVGRIVYKVGTASSRFMEKLGDDRIFYKKNALRRNGGRDCQTGPLGYANLTQYAYLYGVYLTEGTYQGGRGRAPLLPRAR